MTDTKTTVEKTPVAMTDGTTVDFGKKQKLLKTSTIGDDGSVSVRLDFVNGEVRNFAIPSTLMARFAAHGAEQKLGDAIAGESEVADAILSVDALIERLSAGEWAMRREAGAFTGTSVLIQALVERSGKTVEEIKAFLAPKTAQEKTAIRRSEQLRPIIDRIEAAKASKSKTAVDTNALLSELGLDAAPKSKKGE